MTRKDADVSATSATKTPKLLDGIRVRRNRQGQITGYQVRMMIAGKRHIRTYPTPDEANAAQVEWNASRRSGRPPVADLSSDVTLAAAAARWQQRKLQLPSERTGRPLSAESIKGLRRMTRPWREGALAQLPVRFVTREAVLVEYDAWILAGNVSSANDALRVLKRILEDARDHGVKIDDRILGMRPRRHTPRERMALTAEQLLFLTRHAPAWAQRLILVYGTTGARFGELATLTSDRVSLVEGDAWIFVPAALCKERRDKKIPLSPPEVDLFRDQLAATLPQRGLGVGLVFPGARGGQLHHETWRGVLTRAATRAGKAWAQLRPDDVDPFAGLTPHDLRSTAASLMRDAGMLKEDAATRLGHADAGKMLSRIYDKSDAYRRAAAALPAQGLLGSAGLATPAHIAGTASPTQGSVDARQS